MMTYRQLVVQTYINSLVEKERAAYKKYIESNYQDKGALSDYKHWQQQVENLKNGIKEQKKPGTT